MKYCWSSGLLVALTLLASPQSGWTQSVGLNAPRLLTTYPMGGQAGTSFPVTITGQSLDGELQLLFSDSRIQAVRSPATGAQANPLSFQVTIAPETPAGVYEARVLSRLGISASRAFSVGSLPEVTRERPNTTLATALELPLNSVCNAYTTSKAVDHYQFTCEQPCRVVVECSALGVDSKLKPVLMIADADGRDLIADRRHGFLDYQVPRAGRYTIKVHGLTFEGGPEAFYRLILQTLPEDAVASRAPTTEPVNSISLPKAVKQPAALTELEPGNRSTEVQRIALPCDIAGSFFPAADVDTYEFTAKKGDVWWLEIVSERLGLPTNPFVIVQRVVRQGEAETRTDVAEFNDVASPIRLSTNGYSYNGPYYDVGTQDAIGKLEIKEDGQYQIQVRDLFGGTRRDPRCIYRLIIRKAEPDFAIVAWAQHMELRNGDRNVLSKPMALRSGATMIFEVVAVRKDGFDGPIEIRMDDLPPGLSATGLTIPAGKSVGTLLLSAATNVPSAHGFPKLIGQAEVNGKPVQHEGRLASVAWPVVNANADIPMPRLMADLAASVTAEEAAPLTLALPEGGVVVAQANSKLTLPLQLTWRGESSGALRLIPAGAGFEKVKPVEVPLNAATVDVAIDLAALKLPPGEHAFAMYGGLVTKYRYNVAAVEAATEELRRVDEELKMLTADQQAAQADLQAAPVEEKSTAQQKVDDISAKLKQAQSRRTAVDARLKAATAAAAPREIADIVVTEPIRLHVTNAETP